MQYIQTSQESYLYTLLTGLIEAYNSNDIEFTIDSEQFSSDVENEDTFSLFRTLCRAENIHKLDKKCKFTN